MRTEIKGILLPAAAIVLIIAALIGAAFADRALNATEKEPRLDIRFFRSGDGFFILFVCGGVAAVACPYDGDGAGTVASSLKNRMIEKADLLICPDEATAERMKKLLGNYAEQAETVTDIKGEREFSLDTAKLSVKYEGSAYYIRAEHAENTFALCGGDVTFDGFSRNASGADTVTIPITVRMGLSLNIRTR